MVFDWVFDNRTYGKLDAMSRKLDALIEGQKETNAILKKDMMETNDILKKDQKETNALLQEILEKVKIRYPNGVAQA